MSLFYFVLFVLVNGNIVRTLIRDGHFRVWVGSRPMCYTSILFEYINWFSVYM